MLMIRIEIIKCVCFFSTPRCAARSSFVFSLVSPFSLSFCLSVCFSLAFDLSFLWASRRLSRHRQPSSNAASTVFTSCSLRYRFFPFLLLLLLLLLLFLPCSACPAIFHPLHPRLALGDFPFSCLIFTVEVESSKWRRFSSIFFNYYYYH